MKRLLSILFLASIPCFGQVVYKQANVESSGWVLNVTLANEGTNGTFSFGFLTNNSGPSKVVISVMSPGFDDSGNSIAVARTLYGTKQLRFPYPNPNNDAVASGSDCVIRLALSDYVFSGDSNLTLTASANWYSNNVPVTNVMVVVNNSTNTHPKCIANWSEVGYKLDSGNTANGYVVGFHRSATQGRPLRAICGVIADQHGHSKTNFQTSMICTPEPISGQSVSEYRLSWDISSMTQGDLLKKDFICYPWVGGSGAVLSTFDGAHAQPTPLYASITNICNRTGAYGVSYAVIDPTNGVAAGVVTTNFLAGSPPIPFLTIDAAAVAMNSSNKLWFSRTNIGAGVFYVTNGTIKLFGGSSAYGNAADTWYTITPFPGLDRTNVIWNGQTGNKKMSGRTHLLNITIADTNASGTIDREDCVWVDNCFIYSPSGIPFYRSTNYYVTSCVISNLSNGLTPFGANQGSYVLVRGNIIEVQGAATYVYTMIGNKRDVTNNFSSGMLTTEVAGQIIPAAQGSVLAYNSFLGCRSASSMVGQFCNATATTAGMAIVQNVWEWILGGSGQQVLWVAADSSTATPVSNILIWNNTSVGQRWNIAYNDVGTSSLVRTLWSVKNNATDDDNIKTDTFGTPSGNRVGNWSEVWGVGHSGNFGGNVNGIGASGFSHTNAGGLYGLNSFETETSVPANYARYINDAGCPDASSTAIGFGNYRIASSSPLVPWQCEQVLPYDIEGNARGGFDPPGAYASASPRKGGGFFGQ